jgi:hypothetical protein
MNIKKPDIGPLTALILISFFFYKYSYFQSFSGFFGGSDIDNYLSNFGELSMISEFRFDYLYHLISYLFSLFFSFDFFLTLVGVLFFYSIAKFLKKFIGPSKWIPFFLIVCFFYPAYISASELVLRQGIGFSILFFSGFYLGTTSLKKKLACIFVASLFHSSFLLYLIVIWMDKKITSGLRSAVFLWAIIAILYSLDFFVNVVELLPKLDYLSVFLGTYVEAEYVVGFKINFLLLSMIPVVLLFFPGFLRYVREDASRKTIYAYFLISNSIGMLFSGFGYYDRVMLFSWVLIPIIFFSFIYWIFSIRRRVVFD